MGAPPSPPGYHGPPDAHRPERLHAPPRALRVQPARRPRPDHGAGRHGGPAGHGFDGDHGPRRPVRGRRLPPGGEGQGHQADHRGRDLRRPPIDDRQGGQGGRPALPPDPPGPGPGRLPQPLPAHHRRPHRRLLLQAPDRSRAPGQAQRGPHRPVVVPVRRDPQGARGRGLGAGPQPRRRVRRHLREGPLLPRAPGPRHGRPAAAQRAAPASRPGGRAATRRDQRPPLRPRGPVRGARRPPLRRDRQQPRHAEPDEVRHARLLREVGRPDGRALPGQSGGDPQHAPDRRDDRRHAAAGPASYPAFPGPGRLHDRDVAAGRVPARPRAPLRHGHPGAPDAARLRARRDPVDGLRGLLPDRGGLHRVRPRRGHPDDVPGFGAGLDRDVHAGNHAGRPDPLPAAVRTLPQSGPGDDAGHRRRLRGRTPGGGHRLRRPQVRPGPRRADHHLRHDARPCRHPRRRSRAGPLVRGGRPDRQGSPQPAGHPARRGDRDLRGPARYGRGRPGGQAHHRLRTSPRGCRPERFDPRRRGRHQPRAAHRADAAPEGDQLGRSDEPVRDARDRGARPPQVRLPRVCRT